MTPKTHSKSLSPGSSRTAPPDSHFHGLPFPPPVATPVARLLIHKVQGWHFGEHSQPSVYLPPHHRQALYNVERRVQRLWAQQPAVKRQLAPALANCSDHNPVSLQITFVPADSDFQSILSPKALSLLETGLSEVKR